MVKSANPSVLPPVMPWLSEPRADGDVALCARVRLGRNLAEYPFTDTPQSVHPYWDAIAACQEAVEEASAGELELTRIEGVSLKADQASFLRDRALLEEQVPAALAVDVGERTAFLFGGRDHLCITTIEPGLQARAAQERAQHWDQRLEQRLNYAVALDWGYLSTDITELGTAMRASLLFHLPALVEVERFSLLSDVLQERGFRLRKLNDESSSLFWLENRQTIGMSEEVIISKLEDAGRSVVSSEREARTTLLRGRRTEVSERAHRAYGLLQFSRSLSSKEALQLISDLRLGVVCGLLTSIGVPLADSLFFLARDGHISVYCDENNEQQEGERNINQARAQLIQDLLREEPRSPGRLGGIIDV